MEIELSRIHISDVKIREAQHKHKDYEKVKKNISVLGVQMPIIVRPYTDPETKQPVDGEFELIEGLQRVTISRELGRTTIPAVIKDVSDEEAMVLQYACNAFRFANKPVDVLRHYEKLIAMNPGITQEGLAELIGTNQAAVSNILKLRKLNTDFQELTNQGHIPAIVAREVAKHIPLDHQDAEYFLKATEGADTPAIIEWIMQEGERLKALAKGQAKPKPVIAAVPIKRNEMIVKWNLAKAELGTAEPGTEEYVRLGGRLSMIEEVLQVDPETIKRKAEAKAKIAEEKAIALAEKRKRENEEKLAALKAARQANELEPISG